jgi:hypothetical protein
MFFKISGLLSTIVGLALIGVAVMPVCPGGGIRELPDAESARISGGGCTNWGDSKCSGEDGDGCMDYPCAIDGAGNDYHGENQSMERACGGDCGMYSVLVGGCGE